MILRHINSLPKKLRRVTSAGGFIDEIDGFRFIAILPVVLQHLGERINKYTTIVHSNDEGIFEFMILRGSIGVYIFFTISGFILGLPFANHYLNNYKKPKISRYFYRRLTRLEPPYLIVMTILFIVLVIKESNFDGLVVHFISSLFYQHSIIFGSWTPINPPAWTLEIEVQFYIIAPLLSFLVFRIRNDISRRLTLILIILIKIILIGQINSSPRLFLSLGNSLEFFLIGFLLVDFYLKNRLINSRNRQKIYFDIVSILSFVSLMFFWTWEYSVLYRTLFSLALFLFFYGSFNGSFVRAFLKNRWITAIGGMCYTIYLIHLAYAELYINVFRDLVEQSSFLTTLFVHSLIYLPTLFIISMVFFLVIEKPCMNPNWPRVFFSNLRRFSLLKVR